MIKNLKTFIIVTILLIGIIGIGLVTIIDEHDHFIDSKPDCPLCLAALTNFLFLPIIVLIPFIELLLYIIIHILINPYSASINLTFSSRAPPSI